MGKPIVGQRMALLISSLVMDLAVEQLLGTNENDSAYSVSTAHDGSVYVGGLTEEI